MNKSAIFAVQVKKCNNRTYRLDTIETLSKYHQTVRHACIEVSEKREANIETTVKMLEIIYNQNWELCISLCKESFTITYNDTQVEEDKSKKK